MPADRYMPIRHAAASWRSWHLASWWVTRRGRCLRNEGNARSRTVSPVARAAAQLVFFSSNFERELISLVFGHMAPKANSRASGGAPRRVTVDAPVKERASVDVEVGRTLNDAAPGAELWRRSRDDEVAVHDDEDVAKAAREGYISGCISGDRRGRGAACLR